MSQREIAKELAQGTLKKQADVSYVLDRKKARRPSKLDKRDQRLLRGGINVQLIIDSPL